MAIVRSASTAPNKVTLKSSTTQTTSSIQTTLQPSRLAELADTNFGSLGPAQDGHYVFFDNVTQKFDLMSADDLLTAAVSDQNLADEFIDQIEAQINLGDITNSLDGGSF